MNNRIIRVFALITALLLSLSLLFACTDNENADGTDTSVSAASQSEESTKDDTSETEKKNGSNDTEKKEENTKKPADSTGSSKKEGADDLANDIFY